MGPSLGSLEPQGLMIHVGWYLGILSRVVVSGPQVGDPTAHIQHKDPYVYVVFWAATRSIAREISRWVPVPKSGVCIYMYIYTYIITYIYHVYMHIDIYIYVYTHTHVRTLLYSCLDPQGKYAIMTPTRHGNQVSCA